MSFTGHGFFVRVSVGGFGGFGGGFVASEGPRGAGDGLTYPRGGKKAPRGGG